MANLITITNNETETVSFAVQGKRHTIAAGDSKDVHAKDKAQIIGIVKDLDVDVADKNDIGGGIGATGPQGETGATGPQGVAGADGADGADGVVTPAAFVPDAVGTTVAALKTEVNTLKAALVAAGLMAAS